MERLKNMVPGLKPNISQDEELKDCFEVFKQAIQLNGFSTLVWGNAACNLVIRYLAECDEDQMKVCLTQIETCVQMTKEDMMPEEEKE